MDEAPRALLRHELATVSGVKSETLRFYEKEGLLTPVRSEKGYRLYGADDAKRLKLIQRALGVGFGLDDLKAWLSGEQEKIEAGLAAVEQKMEDLEKLRKNLKKRRKGAV